MKKANKMAAPTPQCYCAGAGPRLSALLGATMVNAPGFAHFRSAGVEVLMGIRAILDAQIDALQKKSRKGTRVPVE